MQYVGNSSGPTLTRLGGGGGGGLSIHLMAVEVIPNADAISL